MAIVERVVIELVSPDVVPHHLARPVNQRIYLHEMELCVPVDSAGISTSTSLIPANGRDPRLQMRELARQRGDLPKPAALIRVLGPQFWTVLERLILRSH